MLYICMVWHSTKGFRILNSWSNFILDCCYVTLDGYSLTLSPSAGLSGTRPGEAAGRWVCCSLPPPCWCPPTAACCAPAGSDPRMMSVRWTGWHRRDSPRPPECHRPGPWTAELTPAPPGPDREREENMRWEEFVETRGIISVVECNKIHYWTWVHIWGTCILLVCFLFMALNISTPL